VQDTTPRSNNFRIYFVGIIKTAKNKRKDSKSPNRISSNRRSLNRISLNSKSPNNKSLNRKSLSNNELNHKKQIKQKNKSLAHSHVKSEEKESIPVGRITRSRTKKLEENKRSKQVIENTSFTHF
jgi:hypothetical protein